MEQDVLSLLPDYKLYKDRAVYVGTFLGGPLVAGYLAAENFKKLGQPEKIKNAWIVAVIATLVIFGAIFYIPAIQKVPNYIIPLIYTGIAQVLIQKYQGAAIKEHLEKGGQAYSVWRAIWIGLVGLVILLGLIFLFAFLTDRNLLQE